MNADSRHLEHPMFDPNELLGSTEERFQQMAGCGLSSRILSQARDELIGDCFEGTWCVFWSASYLHLGASEDVRACT